jgi:hypothetical protein
MIDRRRFIIDFWLTVIGVLASCLIAVLCG